MGISLFETIGIGVDWKKVIEDAVEKKDLARLKNAIDKDPDTAKRVVNRFLYLTAAEAGADEILSYLIKFHKKHFNPCFFGNTLVDALEKDVPISCLKILLSNMDEEDINKSFVNMMVRASTEFIEVLFQNYTPPEAVFEGGFYNVAAVGILENLELLKTKVSEAALKKIFEGYILVEAIFCDSNFNDRVDHLGTVKKLLEWGADPNYKYPGDTLSPLGWAAKAGKKDMVIELLLNGASDADGTARSIASEKKHDEIVEIIFNAEKGILPEEDFWQKLNEKRMSDVFTDKSEGIRFV